ncbi:mannosyl-3-phosphoglycerate synthase [Paraphoma chrysanthemicola]|nr:mannosyl-3-phosphoglycerate synthase [Paraphoma chrysanthemicola]
MNEAPATLDGVLRGIPNDCLVILVSNSNVPNFEVESKIFEPICTANERRGIRIHQKDPGIAEAILSAGISALVEPYGNAHLVRSGRGEAMMIGTALTRLAHKRFIDFIDANNFIPGAVSEYCAVYAAGLHYALYQTGTENQYAMVRIKWNSKPKVRDGKIVFEKVGRSSCVTNCWMSRLLTTLTTASADIDHNIDIDDALDFASDTSADRPTSTSTTSDVTNATDLTPFTDMTKPASHNDFVQTANAGEHAMNLNLALNIPFASGYAVEPHQLVHSFSTLSRLERSVQILQIETRNPHFHNSGKGDGHIKRMQASGLSTIYHSPLAPIELKDEIREFCRSGLGEVCGVDGELEDCVVYPCRKGMDCEAFREVLRRGFRR